MSLKTDLRSLQVGGEPEIHERVDLRAWTNLGVGGLADLLIRCRSADGLQRALDLLAAHGRNWLVIGSGSRLVPSDYGLRLPVLNLSGNLGLWELDVDGAVAWGGANLAQVCRAAARTGLDGINSLNSHTGTVGGAIHAAAAGRISLGGVFEWVDLARPGAPVERIDLKRMDCLDEDFGLRLRRRVVLRARLRLSRPDAGPTHRRLDDGGLERWRREPRTAGPVFAGSGETGVDAALAESGVSGMSAGGARLSGEPPDRIRTTRSARASDVLELVQMVRDRVLQRTAVDLECALSFVDEQGRPVNV